MTFVNVTTYQVHGFPDVLYDRKDAIEILRKWGLQHDHPIIETGTTALKIHENSMGVMIFLTKKCLQTVGGFNEGYKIYGCEHAGYAFRARNLKMTGHPTADVVGSEEYFFVADSEDPFHTSTLSQEERTKWGKANDVLFQKDKFSKEKMPYKPGMEAVEIGKKYYQQSMTYLK